MACGDHDHQCNCSHEVLPTYQLDSVSYLKEIAVQLERLNDNLERLLRGEPYSKDLHLPIRVEFSQHLTTALKRLFGK